MQLILVLETRPSCNSDYRYIKATIDYFYKPRSFSIKPVYAKNKSELVKQDTKIEEIIKRYVGVSKVVVCADYDCETSPENTVLESYCNEHGYDLVWMNTNIEHVYLNKTSVKNKEKESVNFLRKSEKILAKLTNLSEPNPLNLTPSTNLIVVLDKYLEKSNIKITVL